MKRLDSCDRFFPSEATMLTMLKGGFRKLIALPLQRGSRDQGNSILPDQQFEPHRDQWAYLSSVRRIDYRSVKLIVADAKRKGDILGVQVSGADDHQAADPRPYLPR